jgi:hypothetical protein
MRIDWIGPDNQILRNPKVRLVQMSLAETARMVVSVLLMVEHFDVIKDERKN